MVLNFTVEIDDDIAVITEDRLVATLEINNLQPGCSQGDCLRLKNSLLVWPSVLKSRRSSTYALRLRRPSSMSKTRDAAHSRGAPHRLPTSACPTSCSTAPLRAAFRGPSRFVTTAKAL